MTRYQVTSIRLPKSIHDAIERQIDATQNYRDAQNRLAIHNSQFNQEMQRAVDANDHEFYPLEQHIKIGQELSDHLDEMRVTLLQAAEATSTAWVLALGLED